MSEFRIVFDEDGYPRELRTAAERERAIARGALTRDTDVIVYRDDEPAYACKAGSIRALWGDPEPEPQAPDSAFPDLPPDDPPAAHGPASPPPAPALIGPPPQRLAHSPKSSPWWWPSLPDPAPRPLETARPHRLSPPPPPAAPDKGGCMATLFWLFLIFLLLLAFT